MGLDMYLNKQYYVQNREHTPDNKRFAITILRGGKPSPIPTDKITYVITEELYWHKANAIHKWFVDHVQDGKDDCGHYGVSKDQLRDLLNTVKQVLAHQKLANELLPTQSGFFFGGTDYDTYYYNDLKYTEQGLERVLTTPNDGYFEYQSSW